MSKPLVGTLLYGLSYHYAYASYISPQFEYAHYSYFPPTIGSLVLAYFLLIAPLVAYRKSAAPAAFGASLIFVLGYVPGELTLLFTWQRGIAELLAVQACLAMSMCALFAASGLGARAEEEVYSGNRISMFVQVVTLICVLLLVLVYGHNMRLVSFADVYDLRFEAADVRTSPVTDYLLSWLSYCLLPFLVSRSIMKKSLSSTLWVLLGSTLIYASSGAKSALILPVMVIALHIVLGRSKEAFLTKLVWTLVGTIVLIVVALPDDGVWVWVKSLVLLRTLATGGWVLSTYYEYFSTNGYTFYTHIGPVEALTGAYPYGDLSLGQVIGNAYVGSTDANFNANFWASDGFAAMGLVGVLVVTVFLCAIMYLINRVSHGYSFRFVGLWMTGFWFALLNMPLTTAMLSGGGALTMLLLWSSRLKWGSRGSQAQPPAAAALPVDYAVQGHK